MVNYNCDKCGFSSKNKKDYTRHIKTKKHQRNVIKVPNSTEVCTPKRPKTPQNKVTQSPNKKTHTSKKVYKCVHCELTFTRSSNLTKHRKICVDLEQELREKEIELLKKQFADYKKQVGKQLHTYEQLLKSVTSPQTINYFNYIVQHYPNTPALEPQESYVNLLEAKTMTLIEVVTMYYYDNKLVNFIGDYIIKLYKKEENKNQSMYATDISRLTYIISECCNKTKENIWSYDKKGSKIKKIIIEPALNYLRENLVKFCQENSESTDTDILKQMLASNGTIQMIDNGELAEKINKYIAPEFTMKINEDLPVIKILN